MLQWNTRGIFVRWVFSLWNCWRKCITHQHKAVNEDSQPCSARSTCSSGRTKQAIWDAPMEGLALRWPAARRREGKAMRFCTEGQQGPQGANLPARQCQSKAVMQTCPPFHLSHPQTPDSFSLAFSSADLWGPNNITQNFYCLGLAVSSYKRTVINIFLSSYVK